MATIIIVEMIHRLAKHGIEARTLWDYPNQMCEIHAKKGDHNIVKKIHLHAPGISDIDINNERMYTVDRIIEEFEKKESEKIIRFMIISDMIKKLEDRGFKAESEYVSEKKVHRIWARKGDWNCVKEVDYYIHEKGADDFLYYARQRQEALDAIFEAYEDYKKKEKEKEKEMANNIEWKVDNITVDKRFGEADTFKAEIVGRINGVVVGDYADIANGLQKKLNAPERKDGMDAWTYVMAGGRQNGKTLMQFKMYAKMLGIDLGSKLPAIQKVIFNNPATIVIWADDTKTVVKAQNNELFDPEKGLAMAITKKALGNEGNYFDTIKKWTKDEPVLKEISHEEYMLENIKSDCELAINKLKAARLNSKVTKAKMAAYVDDTIRLLQEAIGYLGDE